MRVLFFLAMIPGVFSFAPFLDHKTTTTCKSQLYAEAPNCGAPFLKALFPRAYLDPNREAYELDQKMFFEPLPDFVNTKSPRVLAGLGTLPRVFETKQDRFTVKVGWNCASQKRL